MPASDLVLSLCSDCGQWTSRFVCPGCGAEKRVPQVEAAWDEIHGVEGDDVSMLDDIEIVCICGCTWVIDADSVEMEFTRSRRQVTMKVTDGDGEGDGE